MIIAKPLMVQWINSKENSWNWYRNSSSMIQNVTAFLMLRKLILSSNPMMKMKKKEIWQWKQDIIIEKKCIISQNRLSMYFLQGVWTNHCMTDFKANTINFWHSKTNHWFAFFSHFSFSTAIGTEWASFC